jgi:hypothetical protein
VTLTVRSWKGVRFRDALIRSRRRGVQLTRTLHAEGLVGPLVIELLDEIIELALALEEVGASRAGGLLLQRTMHALMTAVLLLMAGLKALDADTQSQPPDRELGKIGPRVPGSIASLVRTLPLSPVPAATAV